MTKRLPGSKKGAPWASPVPPLNYHGLPRGPQGPTKKTSRVPWGDPGRSRAPQFRDKRVRNSPWERLGVLRKRLYFLSKTIHFDNIYF